MDEKSEASMKLLMFSLKTLREQYSGKQVKKLLSAKNLDQFFKILDGK